MSRKALQIAIDALRNHSQQTRPMFITDRAISILEAELAKPEPDCKTCANRGRVDGLSQETHCEHCIYQEKWRTDHYRKEDV
jgi:hypothetical protein